MPLENTHLLGLGRSQQSGDSRRFWIQRHLLRKFSTRPIPKVPTLRGKTIVNLFYESSTRTRISFELAEKRLSADTVNFTTSGSSVKKGETLKDTVRNIEAMKIDMVVVRHQRPACPCF